MKKLFRKEVTIGVCVIAALVLLFVGIEYLKGLNVFKPANYYYVIYEDVAGLEPAAPVVVNGYKVGQVQSVEYMYDNPGHVKVELSLDKELSLPLGTTADIDVSLLGTASVKLNMGTSKEFYEVGSTIEGRVIPGMLDGVTAALQTDLLPNINSISSRADSLLLSLNNVMGDSAIINTLHNLEQFSGSLNTTMTGVNATISRLPAVLDDVNAIAARLQAITADLNVLSSSLANAPIDQTLNNINQMSEELKQLTEKLNNPDSSIGQLLNGSELYDNINKTIEDLDKLFIDIKENPKRYINVKLL